MEGIAWKGLPVAPWKGLETFSRYAVSHMLSHLIYSRLFKQADERAEILCGCYTSTTEVKARWNRDQMHDILGSLASLSNLVRMSAILHERGKSIPANN